MAVFPSETFLKTYAHPRSIEDTGIVCCDTDNFFALWQAWEEESGSSLVPFWGIVWPASLLLCRYLLSNPGLVDGKKVMEIGCGGAIISIVAQKSGAMQTVACDIDPCALAVARYNGKCNGVNLQTICIDPSAGGLRCFPDVIIVADLFYEKEPSRRLLEYLNSQLRKNARVLIADSSRPFTPSSGIRELASAIIEVPMDIEGTPRRRVRIIELQPS